jgi:SPP1 family predicted phage head-tail adaptor
LQHAIGQDKYGDPVDEWTPYKSGIWAEKQGVVGSEFYSSLTTGEKVDIKFETGYIQGTTSKMRIKHNDDIYEIIGPPVNIGDKNLKLLFYCRAVV